MYIHTYIYVYLYIYCRTPKIEHMYRDSIDT